MRLRSELENIQELLQLLAISFAQHGSNTASGYKKGIINGHAQSAKDQQKCEPTVVAST